MRKNHGQLEVVDFEDREVVDLWDCECILVNDHYHIPIPWKKYIEEPSSYCMAISRLESLKRNLVRMQSKVEAVRIVNEVPEVLKRGGFNLVY